MAEGGTRREETPRGGTRREGGAGGVGLTRRDDVAPGFVRVVLPPELGRRFTIVEEFPVSGSEADVLLADEVGTGRRCVIKLYRRGVAPDEEAVARLAGAEHAHVVEVIDRGWAEQCWFEVLEFCEHGSLRTLLMNGPRPEMADVVSEVATALEHVHGLGLVHRDLKPENLLVRTISPLDLVLGDFGLVRSMDASVRWTRAWGTPAYSPPEFEAGEVSSAWDWWSLGMIVAELAAGRHPFELPDRTMLSDQQIRAWLAQRPIDLSEVDDARVRLLCQGLLTRDRRHRWGADQVTGWLEGKTPAVTADRPPQHAARARRVLFAGTEHDSPQELAGSFQEHWAEALRRLFQERDATLVEEVERLLRHHQLDEASRLLALPLNASELARRFADLLAEMDPDLDPTYDGVRVTAAGLEAAAVEVIRAGGDHPMAKVLDEVRRQSILTIWRDLPGMANAPRFQETWSSTNQQLEESVASLKTHGYEPTFTDWALARAWILACALTSAHHVGQLASMVEDLDITYANQQPWWQSLRATPNPSAEDLVLTLLTQPTATQQTHRKVEEEKRREAEQINRKNEEHRQQEENERRSKMQEAGERREISTRMLALGVAIGADVLCWILLAAITDGFRKTGPGGPPNGLDHSLSALAFLFAALAYSGVVVVIIFAAKLRNARRARRTRVR
jgi:serine/threonine protein kinase